MFDADELEEELSLDRVQYKLTKKRRTNEDTKVAED